MEWIKEFDEKFTDNGNGWSSRNIYRDGGRKTITDLKAFITTQITKARNEALEEVANLIEGNMGKAAFTIAHEVRSLKTTV